jgi:hypothetical protein
MKAKVKKIISASLSVLAGLFLIIFPEWTPNFILVIWGVMWLLLGLSGFYVIFNLELDDLYSNIFGKSKK